MRYRTELPREAVRRNERHGGCRSRPYAEADQADGEGLEFRLMCPSHMTRWMRRMSPSDVNVLVAEFVTKAQATAL